MNPPRVGAGVEGGHGARDLCAPDSLLPGRLCLTLSPPYPPQMRTLFSSQVNTKAEEVLPGCDPDPLGLGQC